jgi:hypothetical protein
MGLQSKHSTGTKTLVGSALSFYGRSQREAQVTSCGMTRSPGYLTV